MNTDKFLDNVGLAHLWKRITAYVQGAVPKKMSELKNDMGYTSNGVTSFNGSTGAVVYHGVDTVNGKRGNVQLTIPTKTSELENDSGFITEGGTIDAYTKSQTDTLLNGKQDTIDDLNSIRSGAALGTTALQSYTETDPTVPQWAKAEQKPTYTAQEVGALPANTPLPTGIPSGGTTGQVLKKTSSTDYAVEWSNESGGGGTIEQVQADWDENNTEDPAYIKHKPTIPSLSGYATEQWVTQQNYLTSYTETDPIFTASAAHGITSSDISNWNSKTSNVGTITGITMNGASKGTSGVVNLGTVITAHQSLTDYVQKSQTSGLLKNDGTIDTSTYLTSSTAHQVPSGGNSGQVLKKSSATDYDYAWANQTQDYPSAYCKTAAGTAGKTAACTFWTATANTYLHIVIVYANTSASVLTLNVNSTSAAPLYINGVVSSSTNYTLPAGSYIAFYDGTNWYINTDGTIPKVLHKSSTSGLVKNDGTIDTSTYLTSHQDISGKADKVNNATNGHLAGLDGNGNLTDSGFKIVVTDETTYEGMTKDSNTIYLITET